MSAPKTKAEVRALTSELIQKEVDKVNAEFFDQEVFDRQENLRKWIQAITGNPCMNISDAGALIDKAKELPNGTIFAFAGLSFIKNSIGHLDRTSNYIGVLEDTVLDLTDKKVPKKGFCKNLKIAFQCLLKGEF